MSALQSVASPSNSALDAIVSRIDEISTLPHVAVKVMQVANDPTTDAGDLTLAMESDAALSARVLRCVNSSAYATRRKITNLKQAIAYLGTKQIRNLAVTAAVSELFKDNEAIGSYCRGNLWKHLVSVGLCSRMIASRLNWAEGEDMFLAGLLHDIGIVLEDQHVHTTFCMVIKSLREGTSLSASERNRFGFDHTMMGEKIGELWGFPDCVQAAIRYHHMSTTYRGPESTTVRCVEVANLICSLKGITSVGPQLVNFSQSAFSGLKLSKTDIASLSAELDAEIETNQALFHV
ncbi:MAG TPA: HDOD domain-containing protein [Thermoguttaceae bacterium]|nr:HDOD domain-containing protein [Thermoguttaceae bacterium]